MTPDLTSYSDGLIVIFRPANNTTGAATLNIDSLGARTLVRGDRSALESGDLQASAIHIAIYDSTNSEFVVLNPLSFSLVNGTLSGTLSVTGAVTLNGALTTDNTTADEAGFKGLPQNSQSGNYTCVLADAGRHILSTGASATLTIPANATVPYPIGTALTFLAGGNAGARTIAITSDVLYLAGVGTTGSRTLAPFGSATAIKITSTEWYISGTGLS
jgi:hypothetical protein